MTEKLCSCCRICGRWKGNRQAKTIYIIEVYLYDRWYTANRFCSSKRKTAIEETKSIEFKRANWDKCRVVKYIREEGA